MMHFLQQSKENRDPSPAPVVNVDKFKKPPTPMAPRVPKTSDPAYQEVKESNLRKEPKVTRSPKQSKSEPVVSRSQKEEVSKKACVICCSLHRSITQILPYFNNRLKV